MFWIIFCAKGYLLFNSKIESDSFLKDHRVYSFTNTCITGRELDPEEDLNEDDYPIISITDVLYEEKNESSKKENDKIKKESNVEKHCKYDIIQIGLHEYKLITNCN